MTRVQLGALHLSAVSYDVQTQVFDGPFDLLLHLILSEEVELYDVSLSHIVDGFLAYMTNVDELDLDVATEFLLIAATLVELKTRRLLPGDDAVTLDEELAIWEERDLLLARLLECKTFKDAASMLSERAERAGRSVPRTVGLDDRYLDLTPDLLDGITVGQLHQAFIAATTPKPKPTINFDHIAPIRASVTDAVAELADELPRVGRIGFRALTAALVTRLEVVVRFLAILELFKQGRVDLHQTSTFGDITIEWLGVTDDVADDDDWTAGLTLVDAYEG